MPAQEKTHHDHKSIQVMIFICSISIAKVGINCYSDLRTLYLPIRCGEERANIEDTMSMMENYLCQSKLHI